MTDESFAHANYFEGNEIRTFVQAGSIGTIEVRMPQPPKLREVPRATSDWINREPEMDELEAQLTSEDWDEVALIGPDGIGKTSMAGMLAERLEHHFSDGQIYVDLADGDIRTALRSVLNRLRYPKDLIVDDLPGLRGQFVSATKDKAVLVVVDDAPSRDIALLLKPDSHVGRLLVLGYRWPRERRVLVHPMRDLASEHAAAYLRRIFPDLADEEVEGRIAGRDWRPSHLERLAGALAIARGGDGEHALPADAADQMLEVAYLGLSEPAAWLYRLLCALPGHGVERALLRAIDVGTGELRELVQTRLVGETQGRYRVLARRPMTEGVPTDLAAAVKQVVHYYLRRAQLADPAIQGEDRLRLAEQHHYIEVPGFDDSESALQWMDDNRVGLVEAVRLAQICGWRREQWALAEAMWPLFSNRPDPESVRRCYETAESGLEDDKAKARMLICLGRVLVDLHEYDESESKLAEAVRLAGEHVDLVAAAKEQLGWLYYRQGRMADAEATYREGAESARRERTKALLAKLLGLVYRDQGNDRDARAAFTEAKERFQGRGDRRNVAILEFELAALEVKLDPERHLAEADAAIKRLSEGGWTKPLIDALKRLGEILGDMNGQEMIDAAKEIEHFFGIDP